MSDMSRMNLFAVVMMQAAWLLTESTGLSNADISPPTNLTVVCYNFNCSLSWSFLHGEKSACEWGDLHAPRYTVKFLGVRADDSWGFIVVPGCDGVIACSCSLNGVVLGVGETRYLEVHATVRNKTAMTSEGITFAYYLQGLLYPPEFGVVVASNQATLSIGRMPTVPGRPLLHELEELRPEYTIRYWYQLKTRQRHSAASARYQMQHKQTRISDRVYRIRLNEFAGSSSGFPADVLVCFSLRFSVETIESAGFSRPVCVAANGGGSDSSKIHVVIYSLTAGLMAAVVAAGYAAIMRCRRHLTRTHDKHIPQSLVAVAAQSRVDEAGCDDDADDAVSEVFFKLQQGREHRETFADRSDARQQLLSERRLNKPTLVVPCVGAPGTLSFMPPVECDYVPAPPLSPDSGVDEGAMNYVNVIVNYDGAMVVCRSTASERSEPC